MSGPAIHGNRPVFSASAVLDAIATALSAIKHEDRLTYSDIGAILGKSEDQAAKYCDGSATMDAVTFARGKREWNGRFTGAYDRLCVESRPISCSDRIHKNKIMQAVAALSEALLDADDLSADEHRSVRSRLEEGRDAIEAILGKPALKAVGGRA